MDDELKELLQSTGDRVAALIEQMLKGNWVDDMGHQVRRNKAMDDLKYVLKDIGDFRAKHLGYDAFTLPENSNERS